MNQRKEKPDNGSRRESDGTMTLTSSSSLPEVAMDDDDDDTGYDQHRGARINEKRRQYEAEKVVKEKDNKGSTQVSSNNINHRRSKQPDEPLRQPSNTHASTTSATEASASTTNVESSSPTVKRLGGGNRRKQRQRKPRRGGSSGDKTATVSLASSESAPSYAHDNDCSSDDNDNDDDNATQPGAVRMYGRDGVDRSDRSDNITSAPNGNEMIIGTSSHHTAKKSATAEKDATNTGDDDVLVEAELVERGNFLQPHQITEELRRQIEMETRQQVLRELGNTTAAAATTTVATVVAHPAEDVQIALPSSFNTNNNKDDGIEINEEDTNHMKQRCKRNTVLSILCCIGLLLLVGGIVLGIIIASNNGDQDDLQPEQQQLSPPHQQYDDDLIDIEGGDNSWELIQGGDIGIGPGSYYTDDNTITLIIEEYDSGIHTMDDVWEYVKSYDTVFDNNNGNPIVMFQFFFDQENGGLPTLWAHRKKYMFQNLDSQTGYTPMEWVLFTKEFVNNEQHDGNLGYNVYVRNEQWWEDEKDEQQQIVDPPDRSRDDYCSSPSKEDDEIVGLGVPGMTLQSWYFGHEDGAGSIGLWDECEELCRSDDNCNSWMWRNSANACYLSEDRYLKPILINCCSDHHAFTFNYENCDNNNDEDDDVLVSWEIVEDGNIMIGPGSYYLDDDDDTFTIIKDIIYQDDAWEWVKTYDYTNNPIVMWQFRKDFYPHFQIQAHRLQFMSQNIDSSTGSSPQEFVQNQADWLLDTQGPGNGNTVHVRTDLWWFSQEGRIS